MPTANDPDVQRAREWLIKHHMFSSAGDPYLTDLATLLRDTAAQALEDYANTLDAESREIQAQAAGVDTRTIHIVGTLANLVLDLRRRAAARREGKP